VADILPLREKEIEQEAVILTDSSTPLWLLDEESLRDEGVLFGLSSSDSSAKTDIIFKYFSQLLAPFERKIEETNERIQELNLFIEQRQNRVTALQAKLDNLEAHPPLPRAHQLPRSAVGLLLSVIMCVGNYALIEQSISSTLPQGNWVALGVFMAGMFNLFSAVSMFHEKERSRTGFWRILEEMGMPLAASLFVVAQVIETQPWWRVVALFSFILFLFLFAGKLFLGMVTVFRQDIAIWQQNRQQQLKAEEDQRAYEAEIATLTNEVDDIRTQKWHYLKEQGIAEEEKAKLIGKRDMLIKLFESEFNLARRVKMLGVVTDINTI
jgi:hypothetical protein